MQGMESGLVAAVSGVGTWGIIGLVRTAFPRLWRDILRGRHPRLAAVAVAAACIGGVAASVAGLPMAAAVEAVGFGFSAAVALRQLTKGEREEDLLGGYIGGENGRR
ncbi:MAG: hypothetical protein GWN29_04860 [Gammaproteobacteria bacterium]|nr:hypothetical protein [Gammaproteobacteria bacterium]NIV51085.1 hypothetical protein [Gammaproteobacteria bacterium]NIW23936.1 hypothetical protein [Gammaproteobacteria bacterium]NIX85028.1 hypothetical protein [Gammaproteobacteria bacterium]